MEGAIGSLSNTILMWLIAHSVLVVDATLCKQLIKLSAHVLSSLVIMQCQDACMQMRLCQCFVSFERIQDLTLVLEQIDHPESGVVINEEHPVAMPFRCLHRERPFDIRVNQLKGLICMMQCNAWLTHWVRSST